ncbi:MAG: Asp-tRNA(Asn)/Glu-tRNA(Gln) amidotransferase subunit GatB [Clostridiales bacterium]|jgi:aspartyl-tRNA(Asn)/glutamyl-tRNA(Gln) amidotransferase subunit B|nr:Asp-tRNA(Asn)/Glu-tRNA(Gln) amidotransferase subunit GatB [Clostridiales bacterium]HOB63742.1 Asp-tRNA(Asn)/Glu-tRNA(Gln) amidotransferase subunit GatB [Clostridia bacterium]HOK82520.1 Asp-tRNA(Asn)/Glu-tRNA(Gln) amidotransferase subunit GatB [Clostridia bacterium]HOL61653.1 Asp-tRNA(Asn)/Glu-tRNA(Gln) amidotransferase subunit GatB [Clostridia bacterium]HPO54275.1 Asp-tRNA(Asn)/Glu-tRNA(Gln) amidotransferase subunit GatB [Clostridia bacterium]
MKYEMVVGLETHVELSTKSKIFCSCPTDFGGEPNTHCCPVCTGEPGTLPILNKKVLEYAIKAGLATNCEISRSTHMDRKNYVYPDLPKAYQISQFDEPICKEGYIELDSGRRIGILRIHMEEDAGKLVHEGGYTYVDYNRGGVPLIEIVTKPDIRSIDEAREYLEKLQLILRHIGVSDCKMQEGSMRCDVNISIRPVGQTTFGTRCEIKNMNSLSFIEKALAYEFARQVDLVESGQAVEQETRRFDEVSGTTESMRGKEDAQDYRYFRDPDLPQIEVSEEIIERIKAGLPELPRQKQARYTTELGLPATESALIIKYKNIADYFEKAVAAGASPKNACNLIVTHIFRNFATEEEKEKFALPITPEMLAELIKLLDGGKITANIARDTLTKMLASGKPCTDFLTASDLASVDPAEVDRLCKEAIAANQKAVADFLAGKEIALKAVLGYVMKATRGKANAAEVEAKLISLIKG